jgi:hypothetical protein
MRFHGDKRELLLYYKQSSLLFDPFYSLTFNNNIKIKIEKGTFYSKRGNGPLTLRGRPP